MKKLRSLLLILTCLAMAAGNMVAAPSGASKPTREKIRAVENVEKRSADLVRMSREIWEYAETALHEIRSSKVLADYAEAQGFDVERGVAGMPTAFVASYGSGKPVIGIMGEYDALPGISQKAQSTKQARISGGAGHGCGHNLFGPASMGAALALRDLIEAGEIQGTIRFYGTPAEEAIGGKIYMVRAGLFNDVDAMMAWHPDSETRADTQSSQAMIDFTVEFEGRAAHAAFDPWNGRSALDGLEIFLTALNLMREHVRPTVRMHYSILEGGDVPNVVPEKAKLWCWVRDSKITDVEELMPRVRKMVEGAAMAADVKATLKIQSGSYEMLPNMAGSRALHRNLEWLGPVAFSDEEQAFARELQEQSGVETRGIKTALSPFEENPSPPQGGSTDVADVSWNVPTVHLVVATAPEGIPWHSWAVVAASGTSMGHRGMEHAAKTMAATLVDFFQQPDLRRKMRSEFDLATRDQTYRSYIPDGPPPLPGK
jgi:aminobenzoyl-glutamate utilization protein B